MPLYKAPLRDMRFLMNEVFDYPSHYAALAPIVQRTAEEFGIPYVSYPTMREAVAGHVRFMRHYGEPQAV